jgi:uncharacterized protein
MFFLSKTKKLIFCLLLPVIMAGISAYGFFIEPNNIEVHELRMNGNVFGETMKGMTAIHISDLHMSGTGVREKEVLRIIGDIKPDFIFLTGDYVTWNGDYEAALDFLSKLKAGYGVWAVMGDYDYSNSRKSCLFCHETGTGQPTRRHAVRFLRNTSETVVLPRGQVHVSGIDSGGVEDKQVKDNAPGIILYHSPMEFDMLDNKRDVLMLSGDTHGGQIPLPAWFWRLTGYEKNAKYNHGLYKDGRKMMYVSSGIGTSHIPFRFFRRPEIAVMRF